MIRPPPLPLRSAATLLLLLAAGAASRSPAAAPAAVEEPRLRVMIETDAPGGDPDDEGSLVRFFLYLNEWDVEGLIGTRKASQSRTQTDGEATLLQFIAAYAEVWPNLRRHAPGFPDPAALRRITRQAHTGTAGRDLVLAALARPDPRPLWFLNWGTNDGNRSALRQALDHLRDTDPAALATAHARLRYVEVYQQNHLGAEHRDALPFYLDTFWPELEGPGRLWRWYWRFRPLTENAGGFDADTDLRHGHGPLAARYTITKEGDTMTFTHLIPNGLNVPGRPDWGGWAGRYAYGPHFPGVRPLWANTQRDSLDGVAHRDHTLSRWAVHLQNDFKARADWCVTAAPRTANRPPLPVLNGAAGWAPVELAAAPGARLTLSAAGTTDSDGDALSYRWIHYPEAGTPGSPATLADADTATCRVLLPADAAGREFHVILQVTDAGSPALTRYRRAIVRVAPATAATSDRATVPVTHPPHVWQRWEQVLTATVPHANPYADVTLRVRYTGPGGRTFASFGFWDGGATFRLRAAFPTPGTWHWETDCSDPTDTGLQRRRGTVEVASYRGDNPLYQHGFLRVADNRRHLAWADGTPYLWIGDTAWAGPHRATDTDWEEYLADRVAKRFSLIQVGVAPAWAGATDARGEKPFLDADLNQWNPSYWQAFERKIERANARGLIVLVVGLMEPVRRYPPAAQACLFARNLVARLHGDGVIFSPSFDSRPNPLAHEVGHAVRAATAVHLVTQHPGTGPKVAEPRYALFFADQTYLDFHGVQSGHNGGDRAACARHAIAWPLHLYRLEPVRPVINVEAMYDGQGDRAWQAVDARSQGWRSWLSGAMGYTYGAGDRAPKVPNGSGGIWWWVTAPEAYDHWRQALQWESATQMTHLRDFLAALPWWELAPAHDLVRTQPPEITRRVVLARAPGRDLAVAYLPDNDAIEVDVSGFSSPLSARWFDPVRGRYTAHPEPITPRGNQRLEAPAPGEWVLLLEGAAATRQGRSVAP